jgi:hypothetical protein
MSQSTIYTEEDTWKAPPQVVLEHLLLGEYSFRLPDSAAFSQNPHKQIRKGQYGIIFTLQDTIYLKSHVPNASCVLNLANLGTEIELGNEHEKHMAVLNAFEKMSKEF